MLKDKGFGNEDVCRTKGLSHNCSPMKFDQQYEESDISKNFDEAPLRIYNENHVKRMRGLSILKARAGQRADVTFYVMSCWLLL